MGKKQLLIFSVIAVLLGTAYFTLDSSETRRESPGEVHLFDDVKGDLIQQVVLQQGKDKLELTSRDGTWSIPSRGNFPADATKIRALLLKIFDLTVSQRVPLSTGADKAGQLEKLGVTDSSLEKGESKVSFLDASGKSLAALHVGVSVQGKKNSVFTGRGQYIRREGQDAVYSASLPIEVSAKVASWLLGDILTVLQSTLISIEQAQEGEGMMKTEFTLEHSSLPDFFSGRSKDVDYRGPVPEGHQIDSNGVSQVAGGLENLRAVDVWPKDAPEVKDLHFDARTLFKTVSGQIYEIQTATKGDQFFAKISVAFDQTLADQVQAAFQLAEKDRQASATPAATPSATPSPQPSPEAPKPSNAEESNKQSEKFRPWIYQIPPYQGIALRKTQATLLPTPQSPS